MYSCFSATPSYYDTNFLSYWQVAEFIIIIILLQVAEEPDIADKLPKAIGGNDSSDDDSLSSGNGRSRSKRKMHRRQSQVAERMAQQVASIRFGDDGNQVIPKVHEFEELLYIYCQKPSEMAERHVKGGPLHAGERAVMANLSESQLDHLIEKHPNSLIE